MAETPTVLTKRCRRCGETKAAADMKADGRNRDGFSAFCKACHQAATVAWQQANPDRVNKTRRERHDRNRDEINAARRAGYDGEKSRWRNIRRLYGLSRAAYEQLSADQGDACAICRAPAAGLSRPLAVDHDHSCCATTPTCGRCVRGLLCHACNVALNAVERGPEWIRNALAYLGESSSTINRGAA